MTTAVVLVEGKERNFTTARAVIDSASTSNFITERFAKSLGLSISDETVPVDALGGLTTTSTGNIKIKFKSRTSNYEKETKFQIVSEIAECAPFQPINRKLMKIPQNVILADPDFEKPAPIDILLDVEIALSILCVGQKRTVNTEKNWEFCIQKTLLGWVIGGRVPVTHPIYNQKCMVLNNAEINFDRFWDVDEGLPQQYRSSEEIAAEEHFTKYVSRDSNGKYNVALPFNGKESDLGESKGMALQRLRGIEHRLSKNKELKEQYDTVMNEYIALGHMRAISREEEAAPGYYLPHHAVIKKESLTTKVRVVFDGSAKTTTGISLNDTLMVGPTIQSDLFSLILRFRFHNIVITADIEKMYRQFWIRPEDRRFQRVVWRNSAGEIQSYQLNTVTFGLSAAPFLAIRALQQLADDEAKDFPIASRVLKTDLYVDDALTGAETKEEAIKLRDELTQLLQRGGLNIRQWASNDPALFSDLPRNSVNLQLQTEESPTLKTLGVYWDSRKDRIVYTVRLDETKPRATKRQVMSQTAKIFDPLGLLAPVIIIARIFVQKLWALKVEWDESLPQSIYTEWIDYYSKLKFLNNASFNRRVILPKATRIELHGFCDASQEAYGACLYIRSLNEEGTITTELLTAKIKVAPLKTLSIPRLELCGATLLTALYKTIKNTIPRVDDAYFWTDSTIVLGWLKTPPQRLQTFVANRVAQIQRDSSIEAWKHVKSQENPADLISRGSPPEELIKSKLWRNGPTWLREENTWPHGEIESTPDLPEIKKAACFFTTINAIDEQWQTSLLKRYSSWDKLQRIIAYCLRFKRDDKEREKFLTMNELRAAHKVIMRLTQAGPFKSTIESLRKEKELRSDTRLIKLSPFLDDEGLLRVGGRLKNAALSYTERHPIILPKNNHVTDILIRKEHETNHHSGTHATLYALRQRYWLIDGKTQVGKIVRNCVRCSKIQANSPAYVMGELPTPRVTESRPFTHTGVDYCGPFILKEKKFRNRARIKTYVAVFVCLATKAVHLELVSNLSTETFNAALRRFMGRRGFASHIYSDNGTNFVGANNNLKELLEFLKKEDTQRKIHEFLTLKSVQWHFSPPKSPHFGGLWEAAVKAFKKHLIKVAGVELLFTFEEFNTLIIEIEAILNSRPLTPQSNDPNDLSALTPGHFLTGESLTSLRERDFSSKISNPLQIWDHIQKVKENFWSRWKREYLNELTHRQKWVKGSHPITIDSMVILREDNLPSPCWPLGRVIEIYPGKDGVIRTVSVKTSKGTYKRSVKAVVSLPIQVPEDNNEKSD